MESNAPVVATHKRFHFEFLLPFLFRPRSTFQKVVLKRRTWLTPLLLLSLLTFVRVLLAPQPVSAVPVPDPSVPQPGMGPAGKGGYIPQGNDALISARPQSGGGGAVEGEGMPVEASSGIEFANIFSAISSTFGVWVGWLLLSVLLYVGMVINGSNNSFTETLNLTAWASLPLALRQIVMLVAALVMPSFGTSPTGLAALVSSLSGPLGMFLSPLLKQVDVYLIWQAILIAIGLRQVSPLALRRIIGITLAALILFLLLGAVPGFLGAILAQLTAPVPSGY